MRTARYCYPIRYCQNPVSGTGKSNPKTESKEVRIICLKSNTSVAEPEPVERQYFLEPEPKFFGLAQASGTGM
jgi:hypothetical protein